MFDIPGNRLAFAAAGAADSRWSLVDIVDCFKISLLIKIDTHLSVSSCINVTF